MLIYFIQYLENQSNKCDIQAEGIGIKPVWISQASQSIRLTGWVLTQVTEEVPQHFHEAYVFHNNETIKMMPKKALNNIKHLYD